MGNCLSEINAISPLLDNTCCWYSTVRWGTRNLLLEGELHLGVLGEAGFANDLILVLKLHSLGWELCLQQGTVPGTGSQ